jgi:hypothetical protein
MTGHSLCGWCRDQRLGRIQRRSTSNPASIVLFARIFNAAALAITIGYGALMLGYLAFISKVVSPATGAGGGGEPTFGVMAAVVGAATVLALLLYLPPAIGLGPGRGWLWGWQIAALCFSILGGCATLSALGMLLVAPAIVLFVYWVKPEVRDYCSIGV